jgi:UDP-GlcNAc:undecaprenyl-phosphate GlcNAc-1-phosphate transferase
MYKTVPLFTEAVLLHQSQLIGLFGGVILVGGIGFFDDIKRQPAVLKLFVQFCAAIVAFKSGLEITGLDLPFLPPISLGKMSGPITLVWIVGVVNAVNLIDGLDGLAGGVVLFAAIVNLAAAVSFGAIVPSFLMASSVGAVLGFLIYNWYPAKVYLGDGGAYSLGFILSTSALLAPFQKASTGVALLVPVLATGLPIIDTVLTMFRRTLNRRPVFSPDRGHLHHILLDSGISHKRVVIGLYLVSLVLGSIALVIVLNRHRVVGCCLLILSIIGGFLWGLSVKRNLREVVSRLFGRRCGNQSVVSKN